MAELPNIPTTRPLHPAIAPLLVDAKTACQILGDISDRLLWSMTNAREIPCVRIRRRVLYDPIDLRAWIDANKTEARR